MAAPAVHLQILLGDPLPKAAPLALLEALQSVEVKHSDEGPAGFQLVFSAGRGRGDVLDDPVLIHEKLKPFTRVIIVVSLAGTSSVLFDGVVTHQQYAPSPQAGASTFTVTGEDLTVMMGRIEINREFPGMPETVRLALILATYARYGIVPMVLPPAVISMALPIVKVPQQVGTDLEYIEQLGETFGFKFYLIPGPVAGMSTAYWGPPIRAGVAQRALTFNMGSASNLLSIDFSHEPADMTLTAGLATVFGVTVPFATFASLRQPLTAKPSLTTHLLNARLKIEKLTGDTNSDVIFALLKAQAETDKSTEAVATASGEVDTARYGTILQARALVDVRGVGQSYDGAWYVKSVTHSIKKGEYRQKFALAREGLGALKSKVNA